MKTTVIIFALLGAAWSFPKGAEKLQFKNLHVRPIKQSDPENLIPRIINGHESVPHSIPYQAYLIVTGTEYRWLCGGSLISPSHVITAGHCVDGAISAEVYLGVHNVQIQEVTRVVVNSNKLKRHEAYNEYDITNDIGIIELPEPVELNEYVNVVSLPRRGDDSSFEGANARVSGWGLTEGNGNTSPVLLEVNSTVISNSECNFYYGIVEDTEVCISGDGGVGSCNGDSGGPLVVDNELIGIVSYGVVNCERGYPSAFTRVTSYLDWIELNSDLTF